MSRAPRREHGTVALVVLLAGLLAPPAAVAAETKLLKETATRHDASRFGPDDPPKVEGHLLFDSARGLWTTDGTRRGTKLIEPGVGIGDPCFDGCGSTVIGDVAYFARGTELWRSDGTDGGTRRVVDVAELVDLNAYGSDLRSLTNLDGTLYFTVRDGGHDIGIWTSDGTAGGTHAVGDGATTARLGRLFYFTGADGEPWTADVSTGAAERVKDIRPGSGRSSPEDFMRLGNELFFVADDGTHGLELWKTDGTEDGTTLVRDIQPGAGDSRPQWLAVVGAVLTFAATDGRRGVELWRSDGSEAGTRLVKDIDPGSPSSRPQFLAPFRGSVVFFADDGRHGREPWISDGTAGGTHLIRDIWPGILRGRSGRQRDYATWGFTRAGRFLNFAAGNERTGVEPWRTNGTRAGTRLVADIAPGPDSSLPDWMAGLDGALLFHADDGSDTGQLWKNVP